MEEIESLSKDRECLFEIILELRKSIYKKDKAIRDVVLQETMLEAEKRKWRVWRIS